MSYLITTYAVLYFSINEYRFDSLGTAGFKELDGEMYGVIEYVYDSMQAQHRRYSVRFCEAKICVEVTSWLASSWAAKNKKHGRKL